MKPSRSWKTLFFTALCFFLGIIAVVVRIRAAFNDLWLDEIWSIELVSELHSAIGVFTQTHHDNNHYLNSLFIYFLGQRGNWIGYRIPSVAAGIGTVALAWLIGARRDKCTAFFSSLLVGFSYVLILYSSEARGYASLIFFCFLCFLALQSFFTNPRGTPALVFSLSAILGFTSHLTFLIFLSASLIWFLARLRRKNFTIARIVCWTTACYALPIVYFAVLYLVDVRQIQIGGGTPISVFEGYRMTLAWALGGPNASPWQSLTVLSSVVGLVTGCAVLIKERRDEWIFFLAVIVLVPLAMSLFEHGTLHYVRYFIVALAFLLLLFGWLLGWLFQASRVGQIASVLLALVFLVINAQSVASLLKYGRGQFAGVVDFVIQETNDPARFTFGGEQDFRTQFMLGFYWQHIMGNTPAAYYEHEQWPAGGPEWVIFHEESFRKPVPPGKQFTDKFGNGFALVRTFPTAPLSGVHWFLYRKIPKPAAL